MDRKYNLKLDLQFRCNNSKMKFRQSDNKTSDFFMRVTAGGELFDIDKAIVILAAIKPNQDAQCQFLEVREGKVYADLNSNMKDQVGTYKAQALLIYEDERVSTDVIEYEVTEDNILNQLETAVSSTEEFTMLKEMLSRLSVIENSENERIENEKNRVEAEKLREQAIEKIKEENTSLISTTKKEINDYKEAKDLEIRQNLEEYKEQTTNSIDSYKSSKDIEISQNLEEYKEQTTSDIEEFKRTKSQELDSFKNTKNSEIDNYKKEKDLAINKYIESKNLELENFKSAKSSEIDEYKEAKDKEIDLYKSNKDTLINNKITEVEAAKQNIVSTANNKIDELEQTKLGMQNEVNSKIEEADLRIEELVGYEEEINNLTSKTNEHSTRLNSVEYKNKVQDTYLNGLFNENKDGRLTINGEGNTLKLEGSKEGIVEIESVEGNTLVNVATSKRRLSSYNFTDNGNNTSTADYSTNPQFVGKNIYNAFETIQPYKDKTKYTIITNILENTLESSSNGKIMLTNYTVGEVVRISYNTKGLVVKSFTTNSELAGGWGDNSLQIVVENTITGGKITMTNPIVLEGDFTSKPLPSYFEGMLSSFEECKITEEDIREEKELQDKLNKYKCNVKVTGKNLFDINKVVKELGGSYNDDIYDTTGNKTDTLVKLDIKAPCTFSFTVVESSNGGASTFSFLHSDGSVTYFSTRAPSTPHAFTNKIEKDIVGINFEKWAGDSKISKMQIEEGSVATEYEPYTETNQVVYLNSPLLKGDKLVYKEDGFYHYHKMKKKVFKGEENEGWGGSINTNNNGIKYIQNAGTLETGVSNRKAISDKYPVFSSNQQGLKEENQLVVNSSHVYSNLFYVSTTKNTAQEFKNYIKENPFTLIYEVKEPTYEKILDSKFVVDIPNNATLSVESVVPCKYKKVSYTGNVPSVYGIEDSISDIENHNLEMVATTFDMDYRLLEVEWALEDAGIVGINLNILNKAGGNTMALSRYEQAKIMIIGGAYDKATLTKQLTRYLEKDIITKEEYDELIALMEAKELVTGE